MTDQATQTLSSQLISIRKRAQVKLARFSRLEATDCQEIYLLKENRFHGVRFRLGEFEARWFIDTTTISFHRNNHQIDLIDLAPTPTTVKRAA